MDDYISRQAAIDALRSMQTYKLFEGHDLILIDQAAAMTEMMLLPPADVQPVRHGHWLRTGRTNVYGGFEVECSVCNDNVMITNIEYEHYCRNCGARMDGEQNDDPSKI